MGRLIKNWVLSLFLVKGLWLALFCVFAMLAFPFKSYLQPLIVMLCIPFGMIRAVAGHIIIGYSLSVMSLFGLLTMSCMVVSDSLVLIDFSNAVACLWWTQSGPMLLT